MIGFTSAVFEEIVSEKSPSTNLWKISVLHVL